MKKNICRRINLAATSLKKSHTRPLNKRKNLQNLNIVALINNVFFSFFTLAFRSKRVSYRFSVRQHYYLCRVSSSKDIENDDKMAKLLFTFRKLWVFKYNLCFWYFYSIDISFYKYFTILSKFVMNVCLL